MELQPEWWLCGLAQDIHNSLLQKEARLPPFCVKSPQLTSRRCLVDWLAVVCDNYRVCRTARHLAILLLDYFMDRFVIVEEKLKLVGIGCLLVAAKFEDQEVRIPKAMELNQYVYGSGYTMQTYLKMELMLLDTFDWKIGFPTAAHFTEYFLTGTLDDEDDLHNGQVNGTSDKIKMYMEKYINYFLEISLQDHMYRSYKPSKVCAACVASSRVCLQVSPAWSQKLQKLTRYTWQDLQPIIQVMLRTHSMDEKSNQAGQCSMMMTQVSPMSGTPDSPTYPVTPPTPLTPLNQPTIGQVTAAYNYGTQHSWMMYVS